MKRILYKYYNGINPEVFVWAAGIIILYFIDVNGTSHFTVCPLNNLGIDFCPGCGLGASIHYLLHFEFQNSFYAHPLGIPAFTILSFRIFKLIKDHFNKRKFQLNINN